jgi:homoserine dehydrogenase
VRKYLGHGVHVVSANKTLIAEAGPELSALAARNGASLLYSAAVGGSVPMLEALGNPSSRGGIVAIAGVLNGTCNFVLDKCAEGLSFDEAVRAAQQCGFAEADPSEDLSGRDAARKLTILARHAFGRDVTSIEIEPLSNTNLNAGRAALGAHQALRLVGRVRSAGDRLLGQIRLEPVAGNDAFAQTRAEWNRLLVTYANGEEIAVSGRGAGRWPTTEAVMADLLDLSEAVPPVEQIVASSLSKATSLA